MADDKKAGGDANRDPITKTPGAHPIGVGAGGTGGAAAGAAIGGAVGGPPGALIGGAIGAVAGGLAGKGAAEAVNPTVEDAYWRDNYKTTAYAKADKYERWRPAYEHGWSSYGRYRGKTFDQAEPELRRDWEKSQYAAELGWEKAKNASRDAWHHVERAMPGDADNDGR